MYNDMLDKGFTLQEMDSAINHLKSGKATGSNDIRNEYISYENRQLKPVLKLLFNEIYDTKIYHEQWFSGVIIPIYKKGTREDPSNYRGITLTSAMSKLFTYMLNQRIKLVRRIRHTITGPICLQERLQYHRCNLCPKHNISVLQ